MEVVNAVESLKNVQLSLKKTFENLNAKIQILENDLKVYESKLREKGNEIFDNEEDHRRKDMIIQNMNSGFNNEIVGLKCELEELKSL